MNYPYIDKREMPTVPYELWTDSECEKEHLVKSLAIMSIMAVAGWLFAVCVLAWHFFSTGAL